MKETDQSLKYLWFMTSGCKGINARKLEYFNVFI